MKDFLAQPGTLTEDVNLNIDKVISELIDNTKFEIYNKKYQQKLLRERGIIQGNEVFADALTRVIKALSKVDLTFSDKNSSKRFVESIIGLLDQKKIVLGTPILTYAGIEGRAPAACTVIPIDLRSDLATIKETISPYYQSAMGSGFDFSNLDKPVDTLNNLNVITMEIENTCDRPVASMGSIRCNHPDILEFIQLKREEDFMKWRFNISVNCSDAFMDAVINNETWDLIDNKGNVTETVYAKEVFDTITESAHYCGEPGIFFMDRFEKTNPTPNIKYESTAPCAEVAMAPGEVCQFSYINLSEFVIKNKDKLSVDYEGMRFATDSLVRLLDDNVELSINNAISSKEIIAAKRRIGVGICGLADMFIKLSIPYDSPEAEDLARDIMSLIQFQSKYTSVNLARRRGAFPLFKQSRYMDKHWFDMILGPDTNLVTTKMKEELWGNMMNYGIRNAGTTAVPPTGTSSRLVSTSPSLEPRFSLLQADGSIAPEVESLIKQFIESNNDMNWDDIHLDILRSGTLSDGLPVPEDIKRVLATARELPVHAHFHILTALQSSLDESISKTFNIHNAISQSEVREFLIAAYRDGLKGVTVFRDNCLQERTQSSFIS